MSEPLLYLPNSVKPSGGWNSKGSPAPATAAKKPASYLKYIEAEGRKCGVAHGSHVDDLSAQHKAIWLCGKCRNKFDYKVSHYFYEKNLRVRGSCDACKSFDVESHLFIHESTLTDPGGKSRHGHVWTPR